MAKRCLIVTYYFPPLGGGGVQRITKLIKYLSRKDWQFTVITASEKGANLALDYSLNKELPADLKVIRLQSEVIPLKSWLPIKKSSYWKRWLSAFRYIPDARKSWLPQVKTAVLNELDENNYDCIFISSPPYSLSALADELGKESSLPVIQDMRDPWSSNPYKIHPTAYHFHKDFSMEKEVISRVKFGVSAYETLLDYYQQHITGFEPENWKIIPNGYDEDDFANLNPQRQDPACYNIAFSGTFYSHVNNPGPLFKALAEIRKNASANQKPMKFYHIGQSYIDLQKLSRKFGIEDQVILLGYKEHEQCLDLLAGMDALCFILDTKHKNSDKTIGGKVYEYLRLKRPILALVPPEGEAGRLIRVTDSGTAVDPRDTAAVAGTLIKWSAKPPEFRFTGIETYSREYQAGLFEQVLLRACGKENDE